MGEKSYPVGRFYICFSDVDDEFGCPCTFPHNYNEHLDIGDVQALALLGAVTRLIFDGYYDSLSDGHIYIPQDVPAWILDGVRKIGIAKSNIAELLPHDDSEVRPGRRK